MHVGHLRSTVIGDCLSKIFEFLGHDVLRLNHIGDWGTSFGMLIAYLKETHPEILNKQQKTDLSHLASWYKLAKARFDVDDAFKLRSQQEVVSLQGGDSSALNAWKIICDISRSAYSEVYEILDIRIIDRGESYYNAMLSDVVKDLEQKNLIVESEGAKCVFFDGFIKRDGEPLPLMIQKFDGGYNYATTDIAAIRQRVDEEHADHIIYITDAGQSLHFQMVF